MVCHRNESVNSCVHVLGDYYTSNLYDKGRIVAVSDKYSYAKISVKGGTSGGSILNEKGHLVGILVNGVHKSKNDEYSYRSGFVNLSEINLFLKNVKVLLTNE